MKTAYYTVFAIFFLALAGMYLYAIGAFKDIQKPIIPTQQEHCINAGDNQQDCAFSYKRNCVCNLESDTKKSELMIVYWKDKDEDVVSRFFSSDKNRCMYTGYFEEHTSPQIGKKIYDLRTESFKKYGKDLVIRLIESGYPIYDKKEGLCEFYTRSYFEYVNSLKA